MVTRSSKSVLVQVASVLEELLIYNCVYANPAQLSQTFFTNFLQITQQEIITALCNQVLHDYHLQSCILLGSILKYISILKSHFLKSSSYLFFFMPNTSFKGYERDLNTYFKITYMYIYFLSVPNYIFS